MTFTMTSPDPDSLSPTEIEALRLLAEGHTAKSIAALTGRSVSAVNERLRQARRKTGVSSSRELARLMATQGNRDEKIDLGEASALQSGGDYRKPLVIGATLMTVLILALAAATTLIPSDKASPDPALERANAEIAADPVIKMAVSIEDSISGQARSVRTEPRDAKWADIAEAQLKAKYEGLAQQGHVSIGHIHCTTSVCEVRMTILDRGDTKVNETMRILQSKPYLNVGPDGVATVSGAFFGPDYGAIFYWKRIKTAEPTKA